MATVRVDGQVGSTDAHSHRLTVDKVIIAEKSLGSLLNKLVPGSYRDVTRIDLAALDSVSIKTVGIYGSKSEIVRFLRKENAVNDDTYVSVNRDHPHDADVVLYRGGLLLIPESLEGEIVPRLRSGLYLLANQVIEGSSSVPTFYLIYWPEDTTWDDSAEQSVRRNCITFIRYLTQLTNEVRLLISPEHSSALVWNDDDDEVDVSASDDEESSDSDGDSDRFVQYKVEKVSEEEENIHVEEAFSV